MAENNCRMYEQKFPEVEDLVMVSVKSIAEMGAYVSLLEYNNIEGMILLSELSRRRIRSVNKLIRVGRQEVVVVMRVDKEKGYIDLSKRRVSAEDLQKHEEKYNKSKTVHSIMRHVAETMHRNLEELYIKFGWPLYKKYGHAYEAFKLAISEPDKVFDEFGLEPELKDAVIKNIKRRLTPQPVKLRADIEVTCFNYEGIDAIKSSLKAGLAKATEDTPISIRLVAPPLYVMVTTSLDKEKGLALLNNAITAVKDEISKSKGQITIKAPPRAVSERDDQELASMMEELDRKNKEVSGDDDISDDDDEGMPGPVDPLAAPKKKAADSDDDDDDDDSDDEPDDKDKKKPAPKKAGKSAK